MYVYYCQVFTKSLQSTFGTVTTRFYQGIPLILIQVETVTFNIATVLPFTCIWFSQRATETLLPPLIFATDFCPGILFHLEPPS